MATLTLTRPDIRAARRLVVKIGSALLVEGRTGRLRADWLHALAADVAAARAAGTDVILVSSGSIALGRGVLGLPPARCRWSRARRRRPSARSASRAPTRRRWSRMACAPARSS